MFESPVARRALILSTAAFGAIWAIVLYVVAGMPWHEFVVECFSCRPHVHWPVRLAVLSGAATFLAGVHFAAAGRRARRAAIEIVAATVLFACLVAVAAAFAFRYQYWTVLSAVSPPTMFVDRFLHGGYSTIIGHWSLLPNPRLHEWHFETYGPVYVVIFLVALLPLSVLARWRANHGGAPN